MKPLIVAALLTCCVAAARAEVVFTQWTEDNLGELLAEAGRKQQTVMLVISQTDWCPYCIRLDRDLLSNPAATNIRELTRAWMVLEIFGYDAAGARILREHAVSFLGTPTILILRPTPETRRLGDARIVAGIVSYPDDLMTQLTAVAEGYEALTSVQAAVRKSGTVDNFVTLARVYTEQGNGPAAEHVYRSILYRQDLSEEQRREFRWEMIVRAIQRVSEDHERALTEIGRYASIYPEFVAENEYAYRLAWSLLASDRMLEARLVLNERFRDGGTADLSYDYLYLIFRYPHADLLQEAESFAHAAIAEYPAEAARFYQALGRILRRQGKFRQATDAFREAVELLEQNDENYAVYFGQLEYALSEVAALETK